MFDRVSRYRLLLIVFVALSAGFPVQRLTAQPLSLRVDGVIDQATFRGYEWGIRIESEDGSTVYESRDSDEGYVPASNQKILTTAAAFGLLGPDAVFETRVLYTGSLNGSTITGNLILLGFHDITWHTSVFGSGNADAALDHIAQRVRDAGVTQVNGSVIGYGAMLYNLGSTNTNHQSTSNSAVASRNAEAAAAFRNNLIARGVSVSGGSSGQAGFSPSGTLLLTHRSDEVNGAVYTSRALTLDAACVSINRPSHNPMADLLLRHIGYQLRGEDSYAAGEAEALAWFESVGIDTTGMEMTDGSGLSRYDRVSPRQMVDILRYAVDAFPTFDDTLTVSGVTGTLSGRLTDLAGDVKGKTGSLPNTGVISLSGFVDNDDDGLRYYFSILVNTPGSRTGTQAIDTTATRSGVDDIVRLFGAGRSLPYAAQTMLARNLGDGKVRLEWSFPGHYASGFTVFAGPDADSLASVADVSPVYIIESAAGGLNNADYSETGVMEQSTSHSNAPGLTPGVGSRFARPENQAAATFQPSGLPEGPHQVDVTCFDFASADAHNVQATLTGLGGVESFDFELSEQTAGDIWSPVGEVRFAPGQGHGVAFSNASQTSTDTNSRMNPAATRWTPLFWEESGLAPGSMRYYRVAVKNPDGGLGKASDLAAVRVSDFPKTLIVDGFDRWDFYGDNPDRQSHPFAATTAESLPAWAANDAVANEALLEGRVTPSDYRALVWIAGEESTVYETLNFSEQGVVGDFLAQGGGLFISGAEIGWDLGRAGFSSTEDIDFYNDLLHTNYEADDAQTYNATGVAGGPFDGIAVFAFDDGSNGIYDVDWPDVLSPNGAGASAALNYSGGAGGVAAVAYDGSAGGGRTIYLGFPFETIVEADIRDRIMEDAMRYLGLAPPDFTGWAVY